MTRSTVVRRPSRPAIEQRDRRFELGACDMGRWHPAGPQVTQFFNALSIFFPEGEKFFIDSVRRYRERITDPQLRQDLQGFIGQEAMHGREHRAFNTALAEAGYPVAELETEALALLDLGRRLLPRRAQLGITMALEHFTAIMAEALLSDERLLAGVPPPMAALWRWHAIEESEHKAVAYDVYHALSGRGPRSYLRRCLLMFTATLRFIRQTAHNHVALLRHDGLQRDWRGWGRFLHFLFVNPGALRRILRPYLAYYRPGFHPWQFDSRPQIERWKATYAAHGADIPS